MEVKRIFRGVSAKLVSDFNVSSMYEHQGNKGSFREGALRDFLASDRMPSKFGLGTGEIVSSHGEVSKQSDLIIFDRLNGIPLLYSDTVQVFPVESVYGVIEVKSKLSKDELFKALENIKSVKSLADDGVVRYVKGPIAYTGKSPRPFGIIFAYGLANNSLESLADNLESWEASEEKKFWPNMVVVLDVGVILHTAGMAYCVTNEQILNSSSIIRLHYKEDTFFHFYSTLLSLSALTELLPVDLNKYFKPSQRIRGNVVKNHEGFTMPDSEEVFRLNSDFIQLLLEYSKSVEKISYRELLIRQFGQLPVGMEESQLESKLYLYDPDSLPGILAVSDAADRPSTDEHASALTLIPAHSIEINGDSYVIPYAYFKPDFFEAIPGRVSG
ncbi:DUF6602 domain-containing protein [Pseudomonas koreensis]|uniref:DUF6602 domain-containing protein n=1 Tax=Pseudomonas koreensis TaxID=198620 RepID=UPI003017C5E2